LPDRAGLIEDPSFQEPFRGGMVYLVARVFYEMKDRTEAVLQPAHLTPMQYTLLASIGRWEGMSSAELSRRFKVTPQTMGEMIAPLKRRGLVSPRPNPTNRRMQTLTLTDDGQRLVDDCSDRMRRMEMQMFSALSPGEVDDLRARLSALHAHLGIVAM
jgi:DNA-binding MarR family transcriptional regulator